ncbi:hypothetical protein E4U41_003892 [Claviceps citrina]|nr:hypothetical protein E4U41_003892 [Claviceps citrina]
MGASKRRSDAITHAISRALNNETESPTAKTWGKAIGNFFGLFSLFHLDLTRHQYADFHAMRHDFWDISEDDYAASFQPRAADAADDNGRPREHCPSLKPAGDLGYSGSSFFHTSDGKYLVKSLDRRFESEFFKDELLDPYMAHMKSHPSSLLIRITDMLYAPRATIGSALGIQPSHYIIMENLLHGLGNEQEGATDEAKWETYDLKPDDYFFPERDIAGGMLASDEVIDGLVDEFPDQVLVPPLVKQELIDILTEDTKFFARSNIVDYSLFFARFPKAKVVTASAAEGEDAAATAALVSPSWRTGVPSTDGKWIYRAVLLDFLWAKHKMRAKAMTGLVGAFNFFFKKGPMSITTEPDEYQRRFMRMAKLLLSRRVEGAETSGSASG